MKLTDFETGIEFEFDISAFGAVFNRGLYREVRTIYHDRQQVYKVREQVPEIIRMAQTEKENKNESNNVISKSSRNCN